MQEKNKRGTATLHTTGWPPARSFGTFGGNEGDETRAERLHRTVQGWETHHHVRQACRARKPAGFPATRLRLRPLRWPLRRLAVITGDNAAGKTAFLKAVALALVGTDTARALQPSLQGWIRRGSHEAVIAVEIIASEADKFAQGRRYEHPFWSELKLSDDPGPEVVLTVSDKYRNKGKGPNHGPWSENPSGWYAVGYGPFRRLYGASPDAQRLMVSPSRVARFATMLREDATLGECEMWLKDLHVKKPGNRPKEAQILDGVLKLLNDDFLRNGLRIEKVDSEGLWLRDAGNIVLHLADMSEGYRAALALLVDIVRHVVSVCGPDGLVREVGGRQVVPHSGIVLIDESASHLHPEWQRQIGFWLKERFPNIQFIVTTRSAMLCQAADENMIYHLAAPGAQSEPVRIVGNDYWNIIRSKPEVILVSPAFRMQSPRGVHTVDPGILPLNIEAVTAGRLRAWRNLTRAGNSFLAGLATSTTPRTLEAELLDAVQDIDEYALAQCTFDETAGRRNRFRPYASRTAASGPGLRRRSDPIRRGSGLKPRSARIAAWQAFCALTVGQSSRPAATRSCPASPRGLS